VHAYIVSHLKKEMPSVFGKDTKKKELIGGLVAIFTSLQQQHQISAGDFPNIQRMQEQLQYYDFSKFPLLKPKLLEAVDRMLANDIARLMTLIPKEEEQRTDTAVVKVLFSFLSLLLCHLWTDAFKNKKVICHRVTFYVS